MTKETFGGLLTPWLDHIEARGQAAKTLFENRSMAAAIAEELGAKDQFTSNSGEGEVRGDDLGGLAVHVAARVGTVAAPSEILVSGMVKDLVAGSGIEFDDRDEHQLKGVPGTWKLFAVSA